MTQKSDMSIETFVSIERDEESGGYTRQENVPFSLALMNPQLTMYAHTKPVKEFLDERLKEGRYKVWTTDLFNIPDFFSRGELEDFQGNSETDFFNGYAIACYLQAKSLGKIHINPVLPGLIHDTDRWIDFLSMDMNKEIMFYIDAPYELYLKVTNSNNPTSQEQFESTNETLKGYVEDLLADNAGELH